MARKVRARNDLSAMVDVVPGKKVLIEPDVKIAKTARKRRDRNVRRKMGGQLCVIRPTFFTFECSPAWKFALKAYSLLYNARIKHMGKGDCD